MVRGVISCPQFDWNLGGLGCWDLRDLSWYRWMWLCMVITPRCVKTVGRSAHAERDFVGRHGTLESVAQSDHIAVHEGVVHRQRLGPLRTAWSTANGLVHRQRRTSPCPGSRRRATSASPSRTRRGSPRWSPGSPYCAHPTAQYRRASTSPR